MDQDDVVVLPVNEQRDPEGRILAACINAHLAYERARETRKYLALGLLALSGLVWAAAAWPATFSLDARDWVLSAWAGLAVIVLGTYGRERYLLSRFDQKADRLGPQDAFFRP